MKRKTQVLLFVLIISFIILIAIFAGKNVKENSILPENNNIGTEENVISEENNTIEVEDNGLLEEYTGGTITFDAIAANIVLPPGSTSEDLQTAVYNAATGDIIILSDNITYTATSPAIIIPADKEITIRV